MRSLSLRRLRVGALASVAVVGIAGCGAAAASSSAKQPLTLGFLGALTGARASLGQGMELGAQLAVDQVNSHGGVMGHKLLLVAEDTASDPADAVAAADFEINSDHVVAIIGPTANTTASVLPLAIKANIPELMFGGGAIFDQQSSPYFFRLSPSDTEQAQAMAYFAHIKGWNKVALAVGEAPASQSLVPPLEASLKRMGITIVANVGMTAGQSSYRSEVQQVYANHPQAVLGQFNNTTAGIFFGQASQAGDASVPFIGTNLWYSSAWVSAVGKSIASGPVYLTNSSTTGMIGAEEFIKLIQSKTGSPVPPNGAGFMYDAVTAWALGADAAKSWSWPKIEGGILTASNPPGTQCGSYATCYALLKQGTKINFEGSQSTVDFNKYHNVFGPFAVLRYNAQGTPVTVDNFTAPQLQAAFK